MTNNEPRYHLTATGVFDRWENKMIEVKNIIMGHECAYDLPKSLLVSSMIKEINVRQ